jgi:hypothetical protein
LELSSKTEVISLIAKHYAKKTGRVLPITFGQG